MSRRLSASALSNCGGAFGAVARFILPCVLLLCACLSSGSASSSSSTITTTTSLCKGSNAVSLLAGGILSSLGAASSSATISRDDDCPQDDSDGGVVHLSGPEIGDDDVRAAAGDGGRIAADNTDGIFWSSAVERLLPPPRERSHRQRHWRQHSRNQAISSVRKGCGRLRAAFTVTFEDGRTRACARPQFDVDHLLGSVYGAALARLLGLGGHVPDLVLAEPPELDSERWLSAAGAAAASGERALLQSWRQGQPVAFVDLADEGRLGDAVLPAELAASAGDADARRSTRPHPLNPTAAAKLSAAEAARLAQWSDLVLFDYVTAHSDRIINGFTAARWGGGGRAGRPVHKMAVDTVSGALLYADNEDALFQGHSLLASSADDSGRTYAAYHELLLSRLCVFRASTVAAIERHYRDGDLANRLVEAVERHDAVAERFLPHVSSASLDRMLQPRLANVLSWVRNCSATYGAPLLPPSSALQHRVQAADDARMPSRAVGRS